MKTYCSFCGRDNEEPNITLIEGEAGNAKICDQCIDLCLDILAEEEGIQVSNKEIDKYIAANITSDKKELELIKHFSRQYDAIGYQIDSLLDHLLAQTE